MRARTILCSAVAAATAIAISPATSSADSTSHHLAIARAATAWFHDETVAGAAGYGLPPEGPLHECIAAIDAPGAMGFHFINGDFVSDTVLDPARPEALVYEPTAHGGLRLVALEYVVFAEAWDTEHPGTTPTLFGHEMMLVKSPNRYELPAFYQIHAWVWKYNRGGVHADFNTRVTCNPTLRTGGDLRAV